MKKSKRKAQGFNYITLNEVKSIRKPKQPNKGHEKVVSLVQAKKI